MDGACDSSTEARWSRVLHRIRPEAFLMARHAPRAAAAGAISERHDFVSWARFYVVDLTHAHATRMASEGAQ